MKTLKNIMTQLFDVSSIITTYGYLGIFIIVFLESGIFFALPGDSLLFTAGLFASTFGLNIYFLIPIIFFSTFLGGIIGYEIGVNLEKLRNFTFFRKILKKEHIEKANKFFNEHGKFAITFSRFIPIVAGVAHMKYSLFMKYSIIGSLLWSTTVTLLGYFLGQVFPHLKNYLSWILILIVFISIIPVVFEITEERKKF